MPSPGRSGSRKAVERLKRFTWAYASQPKPSPPSGGEGEFGPVEPRKPKPFGGGAVAELQFGEDEA